MMKYNSRMAGGNLLLFSPNIYAISETFIQAHINKLPFKVISRHGVKWEVTDNRGRKVFPIFWWVGKFLEKIAPRLSQYFLDGLLALHIKTKRVDYVLAEYGVTAAWLVSACRIARVPLYAIFHGFDASVAEVIKENKSKYEEVFQYASGIVAVSKLMKQKLISMGARADIVLWTPCGVDPNCFNNGTPGDNPKVFFSVGRFVEKKAPHLTILAFYKALQEEPGLKLRLIGDGPLYGACKRLVQSLQIDHSVEFLGPKGGDVVAIEMRRARAFVQHSVVAEDGDAEGTPVAVIEAQMTGIPVISTIHAGIPDVVRDGETGFLVNEGDIDEMASRIVELARNPILASKMGRAARRNAVKYFTLDEHINKIASMISG